MKQNEKFIAAGAKLPLRGAAYSGMSNLRFFQNRETGDVVSFKTGYMGTTARRNGCWLNTTAIAWRCLEAFLQCTHG